MSNVETRDKSPDATAFTVQGIRITVRQRDTALAVMADRFTASDVASAFLQAGVPQKAGIAIWPRPVSMDWIPQRAADRLLQTERKAGRIRAVTNRIWEPTHD